MLAQTSGSGATITTVRGVTDASGVATFTMKSSTAGSAAFTAADSLDGITINQTAGVTFEAAPSTSAITGSSSVAIGQAGKTYSVALTSGSSYAWTVPSDASITADGSGPNNNQITVTFGSESGDVTVTETTSAGCIGSPRSLAVVVGPNHAPVAQDKTLTTVKNTANSLSGGKLLVGATDGDSDTLSVNAVSNPSTHGGTVILDSGKVTYTPATDFVGTDTFTFAVSDGNGGTGSATVTVTVSENSSSSPNVVYGPTQDGSEFIVRFAGVPGTTFTVEYTDSLPPNTLWTKLGAVNYTAPGVNDSHPFGVGVFEVRDTLGSSSRYYRTVYPPY